MEPVLKDLLLRDGLVLGPEIGRGSFGTVYRCTDVKTQVSYAVKKIDLRVLRMQPHFVAARLTRECQVLQELKHPGVIRLYKTISTNDAILMIMEMVLGMELFDLIIATNGLDEKQSCATFVQIGSALAYMHSRGVVHRDIKPENILIMGSTSGPGAFGEEASEEKPPDTFENLSPKVKLIDFGLSKSLGTDKGGSMAKSLVGTPRYVAPEIVAIGERQRMSRDLANAHSAGPNLSSFYTEKVDCFSAGVLLHVTLASCFPQFDSAQRVVFTDERIAKVSSDAKDLISKLMLPNPEERMSMKDALVHPWVQRLLPLAAVGALRTAGLLPPEKLNVNLSRPIQNATPHASAGSSRAAVEAGLASSAQSSPSASPPRTPSPHGDDVQVEDLQEMSSTDSGDLNALSEGLGPNGVKRLMSKRETRGQRRQRKLSMESSKSVTSKSGSKSSIEVIETAGIPWSMAPSPDEILADRRMHKKGDSFDENDGNDTDGENDEYMDVVLDQESGGDMLIPRPNKYKEGVVSGKTEALDAELLVTLQSKIAQCFMQSFEAFKSDEVVSPGIVSSAVASRELLNASETILKKLEHTGHSVLDLVNDMTLGIREGEVDMTRSAFSTIKDWIKAIQEESQELLKANVKVIAAVNSTLQLARRRERVREARRAGFRTSDALALEGAFDSSKTSLHATGTGTSGGAVEAAQLGELESTNILKEQERLDLQSESTLLGEQDNAQSAASLTLLRAMRKSESEISAHDGVSSIKQGVLSIEKQGQLVQVGSPAPGPSSTEADNTDLAPINKALGMLQQIDRLLQQHASFWGHMEVVVTVLMQKADHANSIVEWTRNPKLRQRLIERVEEYSNMWLKITQMSQSFQRKQRQLDEGKQLYKFLTQI